MTLGCIALPHWNDYGFYDVFDEISYGQDVWGFDFYDVDWQLSKDNLGFVTFSYATRYFYNRVKN